MRCQASNVHELLISRHVTDEVVREQASFVQCRPTRLSHLTWPTGVHDENVPTWADNWHWSGSRTTGLSCWGAAGI